MKKNSIIILILFLLTFHILRIKPDLPLQKTYSSNIYTIHTQKKTQIEPRIENPKIFGTLMIPQLQLKKTIYPINNINNHVDKNITLLKESTPPVENNSNIILAAHSGNGSIAYFNNLDQLNIGDEIYFLYLNQTYTYRIETIKEYQKSGTLRLNRGKGKYLTLITCKKNTKDKQIVILAKQKEPD